MKLCIRKSDGAVFRPSHPDGYDDGQALVDLFSRKTRFYFRRLHFSARKWWKWRRSWIDTGEVWEPTSGEFDVVDSKDVNAGV